MFISGITNTTSIDRSGKLQNVSPSEIVLIFDSIESYNISHPNEKTGYAIEKRSQITDHVFSPDSKFSFVGRVTTSPLFIRPQVEWDKDVNSSSPKSTPRIKLAYETLKAARDSRSGISISCEEFDLSNYVITNVEMVRDGPSEVGVFNVSLEEQRFATIGTTVLATNVGVAGGGSNVSKGNTQDANGNKSKLEVVETKNLNEANTDLFRSRCAAGRTEFCQVVPESQVTKKFTLGLDNS